MLNFLLGIYALSFILGCVAMYTDKGKYTFGASTFLTLIVTLPVVNTAIMLMFYYSILKDEE